ncbi:hypothetical protein K7432_004849 [Basidiobolus ranarum]|uniref:Zinc/iron permease n=1 Tax=Basidiobolus ranarum TaxID=34480 RepID=A0ABR2WXI9_9FUNG
MDALIWLFVLCIAMLAGSFIAGSIPLAFRLSDEKLRLLSAFGAGLLIGTALIVIIPEGVETLYSVNESHAYEASHPANLYSVPLEKRFTNILPRGIEVEEIGESHYEEFQEKIHINPHRHIGAALALGFAFMFVVEQFGTHQHPQNTHVSLTDFNELSEHLPPVKKRSTVTVGLIVHAAADGIALGAASASRQPSLELLVFVAIMLHKSTSAFGLTTFLLSEGRSRSTIRKHLLLFSLAAPVAAIFTFVLLTAQSMDPITTKQWTGIMLLFSAGTFLFVAVVHSLGEIYKTSSNGHTEKQLSLVQTLCLMTGIFFPLLISMEHEH